MLDPFMQSETTVEDARKLAEEHFADDAMLILQGDRYKGSSGYMAYRAKLMRAMQKEGCELKDIVVTGTKPLNPGEIEVEWTYKRVFPNRPSVCMVGATVFRFGAEGKIDSAINSYRNTSNADTDLASPGI